MSDPCTIEELARFVADVAMRIEALEGLRGPLLSPEQVCRELGVSRRTLGQWCAEREIEHFKRGAVVRFEREAVDKFKRESTRWAKRRAQGTEGQSLRAA